jgi:hypothetical protein
LVILEFHGVVISGGKPWWESCDGPDGLGVGGLNYSQQPGNSFEINYTFKPIAT